MAVVSRGSSRGVRSEGTRRGDVGVWIDTARGAKSRHKHSVHISTCLHVDTDCFEGTEIYLVIVNYSVLEAVSKGSKELRDQSICRPPLALYVLGS